MLIIWKRKGLLVPVSIVLGLLSSFLPCLINHLFNRIFLKNERIELYTDDLGKIYQNDNRSSFFGIKNVTWTKILFYFPIICIGIPVLTLLIK
ncbi:hypothetical protein [Enterococcus plantarum]|uniref:hypothetical protein n=1 Tax=Enterococcus TaxID=1350 RepID=UPI001A900CFC|nr:hypothetical protein [Enterococcus plantarum]MBO0423294.1 hypothetical protein [Enterococcus plantarum]